MKRTPCMPRLALAACVFGFVSFGAGCGGGEAKQPEMTPAEEKQAITELVEGAKERIEFVTQSVDRLRAIDPGKLYDRRLFGKPLKSVSGHIEVISFYDFESDYCALFLSLQQLNEFLDREPASQGLQLDSFQYSVGLVQDADRIAIVNKRVDEAPRVGAEVSGPYDFESGQIVADVAVFDIHDGALVGCIEVRVENETDVVVYEEVGGNNDERLRQQLTDALNRQFEDAVMTYARGQGE